MPVCKRCEQEVPLVSKRGLCTDCSAKAMHDAAKQMHEKKGPIYEKAQARLKAAMEVKHEHI